MVSRSFAAILVDPPWRTTAGSLRGPAGFGGVKGPSKPLPYRTMSVGEIAALPVQDIAAADAHLYLCTINAYVDDAYEVARAWGFQPSTLLTWCKATMGGGLGGAFGISTEFVLFARRGRLKPQRREHGSWFLWRRPYDERGKPKHSAKPPELYRLIEEVTPGPRIELFARKRREGWAAWGNEVKSTIPADPAEWAGQQRLPATAPPRLGDRQVVAADASMSSDQGKHSLDLATKRGADE